MGPADWIEIGRMDELARLNTPVHRLDARAKALVTLAFIGIVMSFPSHSLSALTPFLLYPMALITIGHIPLREMAKKILIASPFAIVIGMFNPLLDPEPIAEIGTVQIAGGWFSFASILFRFALTVGSALALVACTGMYRLGGGLRQLGVPRVFVIQLLFLYRYLFVIADEGTRMLRALRLRSSGTESPGLRVYGSLVGHLLLRSMDRAERVYRAMVARGFTGEIHALHHSKWRMADTLFTLGSIAFFSAARIWNLAEAIAQLPLRILS